MDTVTVPARLVTAIRLCLKDFGPEEDLPGSDAWPEGFTQHQVEPETVPVPEVLRLCLVTIVACHCAGPFEKMRWIVPFSYRRLQCCLALQKFGLRLYLPVQVPANDQPALAAEIVGKLTRACLILERRVLAPFAKGQVDRGNFTLDNQYLQLTAMYQYFRGTAEGNFAASRLDPPSHTDHLSGISDLGAKLEESTVIWNIRSRCRWIGFYNTVAMIDAYFSRLEHLFVLSMPCICWVGSREPLVEFVGQRWGVKYARILDVESDKDAKDFYDRLSRVKERYRNTFAHGGFEKGGASFYVHVPSHGALPVSFSNVRESPAFHPFPMDEVDFIEICGLFNSFETWLKHRLGWVIVYAESGLSLSCDDASLKALRSASSDPKELQQLIERRGCEVDRHANMDY